MPNPIAHGLSVYFLISEINLLKSVWKDDLIPVTPVDDTQ